MSEIPHHGPITRDCPPQCLLHVMSRRAWHPLMRGAAGTAPPKTVGDVLDLYARGRLKDIPGLGPRRIGEIQAALIFAGFDPSAPRPQRTPAPADGARGGGAEGAT